MTATINTDSLIALSPSDKLELIGLLWDSIPEADVTLSPGQMEELDRRLAEADADPEGGNPWEEVYDRVMTRMRTKS